MKKVYNIKLLKPLGYISIQYTKKNLNGKWIVSNKDELDATMFLEEKINILEVLAEKEQLQNNWNELKKMLEKYIESYDNRMCLPFGDIKRLSRERMLLNNVLEKMQELEGKNEYIEEN